MMNKRHVVGFSFAALSVFSFALVTSTLPVLAVNKAAASASDNYYSACGQGHHNIWFQEEMPLKVYIKPGSTDTSWTEKHSELVKKAFCEIASVSNGKLSFVFVTKKPYDIACIYKPLNAKTRAIHEGAITHKTTGPHHIEDATITFHSDDANFNIYERFYEVALHEVGHAVGLGHSTHAEDVMYHELAYGSAKTKYSARDIKTLSMLYAYKPPAQELRMVSRHKMEKLSGGNLENVKVKLNSQNYSTYSQKLTSYLARKLSNNVSDANASFACSYRFLVDGQGEMYNERLIKSSGNDLFDQKVRSVLSMSAPLPKVAGLRMAEVAEFKLSFNPDGQVVDPEDSVPKIASSSSGANELIASSMKLEKLEIPASGVAPQATAQSAPEPPSQTSIKKVEKTNPFESAKVESQPMGSKYDVINAILNDKPVPKAKAPDIDVTAPVVQKSETAPSRAIAPEPQYAAPKEYDSATSKAKPAPKVFDRSGHSVSKVAMAEPTERAVAQKKTEGKPAFAEAPGQQLSLSQWKKIVLKQATQNRKRLNLSGGATVEVSLRIGADGYIKAMDIVTSSGNSLTDSLAKLQCRSQQPYPQPPATKGGAGKVIVKFENE